MGDLQCFTAEVVAVGILDAANGWRMRVKSGSTDCDDHSRRWDVAGVCEEKSDQTSQVSSGC